MTIEASIKVKRRDDGTYEYTADAPGFAAGGFRPDAAAMMEGIEQVLCVLEDRASGGSGIFL